MNTNRQFASTLKSIYLKLSSWFVIHKLGGHMNNETKVKRMRTIKECVEMLKADDPNSAITYNAIKTLCLTNQVSFIKIGTKYLVNYDSLLDYL